MTIDRMLSLFATIVSVVAVPASGYLSYHFAIKGEKRKEFNAVADGLRRKLQGQKKEIDEGFYPGWGESFIRDEDIDNLVDVSGHRNSSKIIATWGSYQLSRPNCGNHADNGDFKMTEPEPVLRDVQKLLKFVKRR